jgi:hypothetical protein
MKKSKSERLKALAEIKAKFEKRHRSSPEEIAKHLSAHDWRWDPNDMMWHKGLGRLSEASTTLPSFIRG